MPTALPFKSLTLWMLVVSWLTVRAAARLAQSGEPRWMVAACEGRASAEPSRVAAAHMC